MPRRRVSIARKLAAIYLLIAVPLIITIAFAYSAWYRAQIDAILLDQTEVARLTSISFSLFLRDIGQAMRSTGGTVLKERYPEEKAQQALAALLPDYPIDNALVTDPSGKVIASSDSRLIGNSLTNYPAFDMIIKHKASSGIQPSERREGSTGFFVTQPIMSKGRLIGIAGCFVNVIKLRDYLSTGFKVTGRNIVDSSGHVIFDSQFPELAKERAYFGSYDFVKKALAGLQTTTMRFKSPGDNSIRFGAEVPISQIDWAAGSTVPANEALAPIRRSLYASIIAAVIIGLAALGVGILFTKRLLASLSSLVEKAKAVGEGRFEESVVLETGDEVEEVARSMDETRRNLKSYVDGLSGAAEVGSLLTSSLRLDTVRGAIVTSLERVLGPAMIWVLLLDESSNELRQFLWHSTRNDKPNENDRKLKASEIWRIFTGKAPQKYENIELSPIDPILSEVLKNSEMNSSMLLPLMAGEKVFGMLIVGLPAPKIDSRNEELIKILASQIAVALENARLYEIERNIASTLQQSLLGKPPEIPGFDIGIVYAPAFEATRIGGDFFDFMQFSKEEVGIFIGDVSGKGLEAATLTAMAKHTVRAFAYQENSPGSVLVRANNALSQETQPTEFITLLYGLLNTTSGTIRFSSAGHPFAFLCKNRCSIAQAALGLPLGSFANAKYGEKQVTLKPGESIIMYTDGVTDARIGGALFGDQGICRAFETSEGNNAQEHAKHIVETARDFAGGKLPDDAAVIVLTMKE